MFNAEQSTTAVSCQLKKITRPQSPNNTIQIKTSDWVHFLPFVIASDHNSRRFKYMHYNISLLKDSLTPDGSWLNRIELILTERIFQFN
jgi:hypothetical protein